ncbi:hypothetical protein V7O66_08590 [Methanolobus sp. ZRKC3]|uniref:hypothetical protein n=1 Tax=Methanolobus sp. ZRKC3 TaxID=3125786 RepID=UPI0032435B15
MVDSVNNTYGIFLRIVRLLADYSEVLIILMILALLFLSFDEVVELIVLIRETFVYPAPPISP